MLRSIMDFMRFCLPSQRRLACAISLLVLPAQAASPIEDVLQRHCAPCHSDKLATSGFSVSSLDSVIRGGSKHGRAVIAGHPEQSPLVKVIKGELSPRMPVGRELALADIKSIETWISSLPPSKDVTSPGEWRWPYQKPIKHDPPQVASGGWIRNPIDNFILSKLEHAAMKPAPPASRCVLARRLYLDLIGMPPSPEELQAFLADESPGVYEKLIAKLLADSRYGERWGRHWLDLARYGETSGLDGDGAIGNVWRYRDWVIEALNSNMP